MNELYYIFLGQFLSKDENCFLNYTNKLNGYYLRFGKYYVDSKFESDTTQPKFTYDEFKRVKKDLPNLLLDDDCLIPVGEIDE